MSSIQVSAHGVVEIGARSSLLDGSEWIELVIKTGDDQELKITAFFRGANKPLAREYAEAIAAVNARHSERIKSSNDDEAEAA